MTEDQPVEYEVIPDNRISIWPISTVPEVFRGDQTDGWVLYVPIALRFAFPQPLYELHAGATIEEEGDGSLLVRAEVPFPMVF